MDMTFEKQEAWVQCYKQAERLVGSGKIPIIIFTGLMMLELQIDRYVTHLCEAVEEGEGDDWEE